MYSNKSVVLGEAPESDSEEIPHRQEKSPASKFTPEEQLPLLHKTLLNKNRELYASMAHIQRYPYEKASKDLNKISSRLVGIQKIIQGANAAVMDLEGRLQKTTTSTFAHSVLFDRAVNNKINTIPEQKF